MVVKRSDTPYPQGEVEKSGGKMGLPHITTFCFCMGLEAGSKFIGFVHLLVSVILLVLASVFADNTRAQIGSPEDEDHLYSSWFHIAVTIACLTVGHVLLAINLIFSAYQRYTTGLRVWVYVMCALLVAAFFYIVGASLYFGLSSTGSDIFVSFLQGMLFFGILAYCIICVYSFYLMVKSCDDMKGPEY